MSFPRLFFESSQSVAVRIGELFNFVWPTAAALWNIRWQVQGYAKVTGLVEVRDLHDRFVDGSGITSANLKVACLETSWEAQKEQFAKFLVFEFCGLYEAWLENVVPRVVDAGHTNQVQKDLQFPTSTSGKKTTGIGRAIQVVNAKQSTLMVSEFLPSLIKHPKNSWGNIEDLLKVYRYFKECRNILIHRGGIAERKTEDAYNEATAVPPSAVGLTRKLDAPAVSVGAPIRLSLDDAAAMSNILQRLIVTLDAALVVADKVEKELLARIKAASKSSHKFLSTKPAKRQRQIHNRLVLAKIPRPAATKLLDQFLVSHGVIF